MKENYEILWELKVAQSSLRKAKTSQRTKLTLPKTNSLNLPDEALPQKWKCCFPPINFQVRLAVSFMEMLTCFFFHLATYQIRQLHLCLVFSAKSDM